MYTFLTKSVSGRRALFWVRKNEFLISAVVTSVKRNTMVRWHVLPISSLFKKSTHDGGRTHNLLIRSQTRCHYATRATVCWKFSIINKYIPTLANITITTLRKLYKRFIDRESLFLIFFRKDEHIVQNIIN